MKTLVVVLTLALGGMTYVAWHNVRPLCDDVVLYPTDNTEQYVCELGLGVGKYNVRYTK